MSTISHRELRDNSSRVLRAVAAGESFIVTDDGTPVAKLMPVDSADAEPRAVRPATRAGDIRSLPRHRITGTLSQALADLRGDR